MTLLHVVRVADDPARRDACDAQAVVCAAVIAATPAEQHRVLVVGGARAHRRAASLGLRCHGRVSPLLGRCGGAARAIARVARAWGVHDLVQTYGLDTVAAAATDSSRRVLLADCLGRAPAPSGASLPPRLGPASSAAPSRDQIRAALGVHEDALLVMALGDPPDQVDAHAVGEAVAMLNVAGIRASVVLPIGARGLDRVRRHACEGYLQRLYATEQSMWTLVAGADVTVVSSTPPGPTLATRMMARYALEQAIPVIVPAGHAWDHLGGAALIAAENRGARLASACFQWLERQRPRPSPPDDRGPTIVEEIIAMWRRESAKSAP